MKETATMRAAGRCRLNFISMDDCDAFEEDVLKVARRYWGPSLPTREEFIGSISRYMSGRFKQED